MSEEMSQLCRDVLKWLADTGMSETEFAQRTRTGAQWVKKLRGGRRCGPEVERRVRTFMADRANAGRRRSRGAANAAKYTATVRRNAEADRAARDHRLTDETELAKKWIRQCRFHCFNAEITKPEMIGWFFIGPNLVDREGLLAFARRHGFQWDKTEEG